VWRLTGHKAVATIIISSYYLFATIRAPHLYHKIPIVVLEIFQFLWWLSSWTVLARWAALASVWASDLNYLASLEGNSSVSGSAWAGILGAAAFFAAVCCKLLLST
jgi:hypothetical protein